MKTPLTVKSVLLALEERAPSASAEKWDNVGLLVGSASARVRGAVVSIDLTERSIERAKKSKSNLIVNHHPCIFPRGKGLSRVTEGEGGSKLVFDAVKNGISVLSVHTNFDRCALEVPHQVSKALGCHPVGRLFDGELGELLKLVVFVPEGSVDRVREAICNAGAGKIGNYDQCTFSSSGEGTYRGGLGTNPFIGKPGRLERARELKLETVFPRGLKSKILKAMKSAHPYEEIAYDLFSVEQTPSGVGLVSGLGYGFVGEFTRSISQAELQKRIKRAFKVRNFWMTNQGSKKIHRIGFVAGKGSSFLKSAIHSGCDVFITGEAGYHDAREASRDGMTVIELGHTQSELYFLKTAEKWLSDLGIKTQVDYSETQTIY